MTTVGELDRVTALVADLTSLGKVVPGDMVRAETWNRLVRLVISVAQAVLTSPAEGTVPPHEHPDQVKLSWFDPSVRSLIEKGPLADPVAVGHVIAVDHRVNLLSTDLEAAQAATANARDRLAELSARELVRDANVTEVSRVVTALDQRKDAIVELRQTLDSIQAKVDQAIAVGTHLTINGVLVDMDVIDQRIRSVEDLRHGLTLADGQLLDAHAFEGRLLALQNSVVTQAQLDAALKLHATEVPPETITALQAAVTTSLRTEFNASFDKLRTDVAATTDRKLASVDGTVAARLDERLPGALAQALSDVRSLIATTADGVRKDLTALADSKANAATDVVRKEVATRIEELVAGLGANIQSVLDAQLPPKLAAITASVTKVSADTATALAALKTLSDDLQTLRTRAEQIALLGDAAIKTARQDLLAEVDKRNTASSDALGKRLDELDRGLDARIDQRIATALTALRGELPASMPKLAADAATAALRPLLVQLRADMTTIARDEDTASEERVKTAVLAQIDTSFTARVIAILRSLKLIPSTPVTGTPGTPADIKPGPVT